MMRRPPLSTLDRSSAASDVYKRQIYSLSAPELQSLPSIGTAKEFDLEGCAALTPDLVIVPAKLKDSIHQMEELGLTVLAVKPELSLIHI